MRALTSGVVDSGFTGNVTVAIATGTGVLSGTTVKAAVAGVATFTNLVITGTGAHTLSATATSYTSATSATVAVIGVLEATLQISTAGVVYNGTAASGTNVHIATGSQSALLYRRSTNSGASFSGDTLLPSPGTTELDQPVVASGNFVGIATIAAITNIPSGRWLGDFTPRIQGGAVSVRRSINNGTNWLPPVLVSFANSIAFRVGFAIQPPYWHIAWMDIQPGTATPNAFWDIWYARSTDDGASFAAPIRLAQGTNLIGAERPVLAVDGPNVHMVSMDARDNRGSCPIEGNNPIPNCTEVYYKRSTNNGFSWEADRRLTNMGFWGDGTTVAYAGRPFVTAKAGVVLVECDTRRSTIGNDIGFLRSTNDGTDWSAISYLTNSAGESTHGTIAFGSSPNEAVIIWQDEEGGTTYDYERYTVDTGLTWTPARKVSIAPSDTGDVSCTTGYSHWVYSDKNFGLLRHRRHPMTPTPFVYAVSLSFADVSAAVTAAVDGQTVVLPAGSATWATTLSINKAITLQGAGAGTTQDPGLTIIRNGTPAGSSLLNWGLVANKTSRMTGIEFQETFSHTSPPAYCVNLFGTTNLDTRRMRMDHCTFRGIAGLNVSVNNTIGVIDHCNFFPAGQGIPLYFFNATWNESGVAQGAGYGSMADTNHFGTDQFMFVESCVFTYQGQPYGISDSNSGARYVIRNNIINNGWIEAHQGGGGFVGTRCAEIYGNQFINPGANAVLVANIRSGVWVIHDNTSTFPGVPVIQVADYAVSGSSFFGISDGRNVWDVNGTPAQYTGTSTSAAVSGATGTVTVSGATWTTNQWRTFSVVKTSTVTNMGRAAEILSNTSTTLTFARKGAYGVPDLSFTTGGGETFEINKVTHSFDMPGRSGGTLIVGTPLTNPAIPPVGWNNQITDPCYEWNNTYNSGAGNIDFTSESGILRINEHYFNDTPKPGYTPFGAHPLITGDPLPPPVLGPVLVTAGPLLFGNRIVDSPRQKPYILTNTGDATLTITGISYPPGFTDDYGGGTIAAGASHGFFITFSPTDVVGYGGVATIASDATNGLVTFSISGVGVPAASTGAAGGGRLIFASKLI